ncbi:actin-binding FH2 [Rhizoclosmatium globosum]|uniref:Actin-binding FH2 n=1 Tax=Rhizoclosmatium globosum TaxID=329046 RepID=A0A1Y2CIF6_9FUNG|nr:actin-binding FH2 [Rhizoclosmatium globosum]|eukprot:ORY46833.1 actin-binding FH2 [Rhizoclosmatium globosum]
MSRPQVPVLTPDAFYPQDRERERNSILGRGAASPSAPTASVIKDPAFRAMVASLDVTRITDRVIACGLPWAKASDQKGHRNNAKDLARFLKARYKDKFMMWNLTGDTSLGAYDPSLFNNQVVSFGLSKAYQLSLKTLLDVARSIHAWLKLDHENVAIVHCANGVGRTGLAIATLLRFDDTFVDAATAFEFFVARRTPHDQSWPSVSMRRYVQYINNTILVNGYGSCRPGIEVYQQRKLVWSSVYSRFDSSGVVEVDLEEDRIVFGFGESGLVLERDVQIRIFHCADVDDGVSPPTQVITMVNFSFHTGFMPPGFIRVAARDLDLSRRDVEEGRFGAGFSMDLVFDEAAVADEGKVVGYTKSLDKNINKCLPRLISYHVVKVDERMLKGLEGMGIDRLFACIALQRTNNDIKAAYEYYKSVLAPPIPSPVPPAPQLRTSPPTSAQTTDGGRRAPPTISNLRQQTAARNRDLSPTQNSGRAPLNRKLSTTSSDGFLSDGSVGSGVRTSIQRLETLLQQSNAPLVPPPRKTSRTAKSEEEAKSQALLEQLKAREGGVPMTFTTSAPSAAALTRQPSWSETTSTTTVAPTPPPETGEDYDLDYLEIRAGTPDIPVPPPEPTPEPVVEEKLTKLRESETTRKANVLKKRQTLHWKGKDGGAGEVSGEETEEVTVQKFEELFSFVPGSGRDGANLCKTQFTTLLDFRRANVIAIGMSRFTRQNITGAQLAQAVTNLDTSKLLKQLIPTESEARILNQYYNSTHPPNALPLAPAETFMTDLIKSDLDIGQHVEAFLFLQQLPHESKDMISQLQSMISMCTQLQTSSDLKVILRLFRPWMGKEAKAIGFRIDGLARLKDVKSADGGWSLMSLLVGLVDKNRPDVLDFTQKFHELKKIRHIELRVLMAHLIQLESGLAALEGYQYKNLQFLALLKPRLQQAATDLTTLRTHFTILHQTWMETARYFAEDPDDYLQIPELLEIVAANPDPNYHMKMQQQDSGDLRKQVMHIFTAMHVFMFGFEESVKEMRRKVEEEARRLVREAQIAEERRRREEARAIKEGRIAPPVQQQQQQQYPVGMDVPGARPILGNGGMNAAALRNRASMMLLQKKEVEAKDMLARFSTLGGLSDYEMMQRAEEAEEEFALAEIGLGDSGSEAGHSDGGVGYHGSKDRDSFQSVQSAYPAPTIVDGKEICQECFIPKEDCYCNW